MKDRWKAWTMAARPKTISAAFVPILVATALAKAMLGSVQWDISFSALLATIFLQIGTNLVNDAKDFKKGADTKDRIGPVRAVQSGLLTAEQVLARGMICFGVALFFSLPLMIYGGWPLALIMTFSVICGYAYTGGPFPLAYNGLGDLFVLLFYGFIAIGSTFYLQGGEVGFAALLAGAEVGLLSTVMIAVNNLRDIQQDRRVNKKTLSVRFGEQFGRLEITCLLALPYLLNLIWLGWGQAVTAFLPFFALPLATFVIQGIWKEEPGPIYNKFLGISGLHHLAFGILLSLGLLWG